MCARIICVIVISIFVAKNNCSDNFLDTVQNQCIQRCPLQNHTDDGQFECAYDCKIDQCNQGCKLWNRALESSCKTVCNGTQDIVLMKELYCVMGCNDAMTRYFTLLKEQIGTPPAPALVADTLTATSLSLKWDFGSVEYAGVRYLVQWMYEELSAEWQYCRNQTWGTQDVVFVDNLQPYTKYRFRVALLLSQHHGEPIVSEPSVVISTLGRGTPASAPAIVRAVAVDWSRISVSWEPGPFPHGPILSYVLNISENHLHGYSALKDIPASDDNFYMFQNLVPSTNYTVSVAMRNGIGEGPAAFITVTTPKEPEIKDTRKPILILGGRYTVIQQGEDLVDDAVVIYNTSSLIKGLSIHVRKQLLFISEEPDYIYKTSLNQAHANKTNFLTPQNLKFEPMDLSIDWLNDQLYILGEVSHSSKSKVYYQITRCNLDGTGMTVAVAGLLTKPHHIEVDPYNGFLFWVIDGTSRAGLYRLDLADISNGVKHEVQPYIILERPNLGAFTVDHTKFHLLVPDRTANTVFSVSFDGREIHNLRINTQKPMFLDVLSLATANGLFYWTSGKEVMTEEHYPVDNNYFHNVYPALRGQYYTTILVDLPNSQPIPIPINPPTGLQAILGSNLAKTSWQMPHLLGGQGKGAWQNWSYEINIKDLTNSKTISHRGINTTSYTIQNLKENTEYVIKTAAYTSSGTGPWSSEFRGKTLRRTSYDRYPAIIWSASEGVVTSDVTGEHVQSLIHKSHMKDYYITAITWYQNQLYLVSNTSHMYWYNMSNHRSGRVSDVDSVGSVAVDWVGKKLYWSNPKQQLIIRGNLNGAQQEPLPILTVAKELNIDSINAYIYWSTGHAIECARLNGVDRIVYHPAQLFSGKQVMGLTLDHEQQTVYWIVRSYEGSTLFKEKMAQKLSYPGTAPSPIRVSNLQKPNMQGPLCYFSDHLLWLQDDKNAIIGDMNGQNTAVISGITLSGLTMVSVLDPLVHSWPGNQNKEVNVIPGPVLFDTVRVEGTWENFNITWTPSNTTDYGKLFYEVKINDGSKKDTMKVTTNPFIQYWKNVPPYTRLDIAIRAYTFWGSASQTRIQLHSPSHTPSAPQNTRCYTSYNRNPFTSQENLIIFRWDSPDHCNGIINGYIVNCWSESSGDVCNNASIAPGEQQFEVGNLTEHQTYFFQVQAFTYIGNGNESEIIACNSNEEEPVPLLLASSSDSIYLQDFDVHKNETILRNVIQPTDISYSFYERRIFWINEAQELFMIDKDGSNKSKLLSLNGTGVSLSLDWIERCLYFVQNEIIRSGSSIFKLDLNKVDKGTIELEPVISIPHKIVNLEVSPFTRKLYWMEINQNQKKVLMQADSDGQNIEYFFGRNRLSYKRFPNSEYFPCNCPDHELIDKSFAVDHSEANNKPQILFIDSNTEEIVSADKLGCICKPAVEKNLIENSFPIGYLTGDKGTIYWRNNSYNQVFSLNKNDEEISVEKMEAFNFLIFGSHTQPFPASKCLVPKQSLSQVSLHSKTSDSITLKMPPVFKQEGCEDVSVASVEFSIYYQPYFNEEDVTQCDETCTKITTFAGTLKVGGLRPFAKYMFSVAVRNFYSDVQGLEDIISPGIVFQTAVGAPSAPENVTAIVLNPTMVSVKWLPPQILNGDAVSYEIHYQTESKVSGVRQKGEQTVSKENVADDLIEQQKYKICDLLNLSSNQTYLIWVRAYSENNETFTDSDKILVQTYPDPNDILLKNSSSSSLAIMWTWSLHIQNCLVQYTDVISNHWRDITISNATSAAFYSPPNNIIDLSINDLKPKMKYRFRLALKYAKYNDMYIWPPDTRFVFETLGDRPSPPSMPSIGHKKGDIYQVSWEAAKDNGAPIELYNLEANGYRSYRTKRNTNLNRNHNRTAFFYDAPSIEEEDDDAWISFYNGSETYWIISGLNPDYRYVFRVSALNSYGWSNYSDMSMEFNPIAAATIAERHEQFGLIIGVAVPFLMVILVFVTFCLVYSLRRKNKEKKNAQAMLANRPINPDVELATLRELPRRNNFIHNTNALYVSALPSPEELALLPQINRDQITLIHFLGRGAFGEVYEGKARKIGGGTETKVAVKTLRKGATEQEKIEFLQEAQLMSHFKHEHILQLLGVCLDTHFIIMELMEGGDLLTYLRSNRKPVSASDALTILDLLSMCVDVARGCRYLEEMHFVHRDLACRNCLVSSTDRQSRVVKIGDFGLARDIYKNDYYRKEGEGLLPVRWMAPESLVDGVFTCQSDVWAFGVLMWEIMTLGQQPYQARNNLEVLHYVKGGGRLEKPSHCPQHMHKLMMDCWTYSPSSRPTFKYGLEVLEELKSSTIDGPLTAIQTGDYISTIPNVHNHKGISNVAYFQDENENSSGSSWKTGSGEETARDQVPLVQPSYYKSLVLNGHVPKSISQPGSVEIPKYLEIICDGCEPPFNDGYEVPRSSIRSNRSVLSEENNRTIANSKNKNSDDLVKANANGVIKDILCNNEKDPNIGEMCSFTSLTTQPLLEAEENTVDCNHLKHHLSQAVC